ncbi:hypothetical protein [Leptothermofonsia sp. ETS-13]
MPLALEPPNAIATIPLNCLQAIDNMVNELRQLLIHSALSHRCS